MSRKVEANGDSVVSAEAIGLHYVSDQDVGIRREKLRGGFRYRLSTGAIVRQPQTLQRISSLAIPPAWKEVWICADPKGHLQATGRDACRRKQYRYHPRWRKIRDETKYARMVAFGKAQARHG